MKLNSKFPALTKHQKKFFEYLLKLVFVVLATFFVISRFKDDAYQGILSYSWSYPWLIIPQFISLWALNLFLDALIWKNVHQFIAPTTLRRAFKTNLICYALSFITPANTGELAGRYVMMQGSDQRRKTLFLTWWSHFPRLIVKVLIGGSALLSLAVSYGLLSLTAGYSCIGLLSILSLGIFFRFTAIQKWLGQHGWRNFAIKDYVLHNRPAQLEKLRLLALALLKFLTYNTQFLLLLLLWGGYDFNLELFWTVLTFYAVSAFVPGFAAADFLIKGAIAILIFDPAIADESLLLNASFMIWAFNIAIPALAGTTVIFRTNLNHAIKKKFSRGSLYGSGR